MNSTVILYGCQLKKYTHNLNLRVMFYSVDMLRTSSLGGSISSNPEKTAPRRQCTMFLEYIFSAWNILFQKVFQRDIHQRTELSLSY